MRKRTWRKWAACALTAGLVLQSVGAVGFADEAVYFGENAFDEAGYADGDGFNVEVNVSPEVILEETSETADFYAEDQAWDIQETSEDALFSVDGDDDSGISADDATYFWDESSDAASESYGLVEESRDDLSEDVLIEAVQVESLSDPEPALAVDSELMGSEDGVKIFTDEVVDMETANVPDAPDNSEELFEKLAEIELYGDVQEEDGAGGVMSQTAAESADFMAVDNLEGTNKYVYNGLIPQIKEVSGGSKTSTRFSVAAEDKGYSGITKTSAELGIDEIYGDDGKLTNAVKSAMVKAYLNEHKDLACTANRILSAVLADLPYDLYWFDKTVGLSVEYSAKYEETKLPTGGYSITLTKFSGYVVSFVVADEFVDANAKAEAIEKARAEGTAEDKVKVYVVDQSSRESLNKANENIKQILSKYSALNDYDKLFAYCNEICSMVSYNSEAASGSLSGKVPYGNPWQLIWVFDGDSTTNVVCEGYAKAFQYLSQMSTFNYKDLEVRGISGFRNKSKAASSKHMWNIVRMEDGANYLVDPTNCDAGSSANKKFFLVGAKGSVSEGYTNANSVNPYVYNDSAIRAYSTDELTLVPYEYGHVHTEEILPAKAATCTEGGLTEGIVCSSCGMVIKEQKETAPSHSVVAIQGKEATCTQKGLSTGLKCVLCGQILKEQKELPMKAHTDDEGTITKQPTVFATGTRTYKCTVCGTVTKTEVVPKLEPVLELSKTALSMKASDKKTVTASVANGDAIASVTSSDKTIAKAAKNKLTITIYSLKKAGSASIEVTLKSGLKKTISVTVVDKVVDITGLSSALKIKKGNKLQLSPKLVPTNSTKKITYKTSDKSIAAVSNTGLITAKKKGKATITVTAGAVSKKISVTVTA
ncbi:MAG: Ig-like domain-containing protein [Lachnospiraceae bacterium]|nr:Ig-like domain-containing protein [Lachnospiraceae bacterium]